MTDGDKVAIVNRLPVPTQIALLEALASGSSVRDAAEAIGCDKNTAHAYARSGNFAGRLAALRVEDGDRIDAAKRGRPKTRPVSGWDKEAYAKVKELGLCVRCQRRPATQGMTRCDSCRARWDRGGGLHAVAGIPLEARAGIWNGIVEGKTIREIASVVHVDRSTVAAFIEVAGETIGQFLDKTLRRLKVRVVDLWTTPAAVGGKPVSITMAGDPESRLILEATLAEDEGDEEAVRKSIARRCSIDGLHAQVQIRVVKRPPSLSIGWMKTLEGARGWLAVQVAHHDFVKRDAQGKTAAMLGGAALRPYSVVDLLNRCDIAIKNKLDVRESVASVSDGFDSIWAVDDD